jgi:predicted AlkP superfamily pyrophosphatase or phosphodiesterase
MTFRLAEQAQALEQRLLANRLLDVDASWASELVFPSYDGLSLKNIPHTMAELLNAPTLHSAPLDEAVWGGERPTQSIQRVVGFLMDGMGYRHLMMLIEQDEEIRQIVSDLTDGRGPIPLTSVAPSTTAVALTTLWTGNAPGEHGIAGTYTYLREFSMIGDMLAFRPVPGKSAPDTFASWGMTPADIVSVPGVCEHFVAQGVDTHLVLHHMLTGTGLSRILHRGVNKVHTHLAYADFPLRMRDALRSTQGQRAYISIYWPAMDSIAHAYGAHTPYTAAEIKTQLKALRDMMSDPTLSDGQTILFIMADHGHYDSLNPISLMSEQAEPIRKGLALSLTGDERFAYAYVRDGHRARIVDTIHKHYGEQLAVVETEAAMAAGLFGDPAQLSAEAPYRFGDLVLIPRLGYRLIDPVVPPTNLVSVHAGLDAWEMLIPLMWRVF